MNPRTEESDDEGALLRLLCPFLSVDELSDDEVAQVLAGIAAWIPPSVREPRLYILKGTEAAGPPGSSLSPSFPLS